MSSDRTPEQVAAMAWKEQPTTGMRLSESEMLTRMQSDRRRERRATLATLGLIVASVAWFMGILVTGETDVVRRTGLIVTVGGLAFSAWQLLAQFRRIHAARIDTDRMAADSVTAMRAYLVARHKFHSGAWLWSRLAALLPGVPIVAYGFARDPDLAGTTMVVPVAYAPLLWIGLLAYGLLFVQLPAARRYQRQLRELDRLGSSAINTMRH